MLTCLKKGEKWNFFQNNNRDPCKEEIKIRCCDLKNLRSKLLGYTTYYSLSLIHVVSSDVCESVCL
jgi:hypothetical protein